MTTFFPTFSGLVLALYQRNLPANVYTRKCISVQENYINWNLKMNNYMCDNVELYHFLKIEKMYLIEKQHTHNVRKWSVNTQF